MLPSEVQGQIDFSGMGTNRADILAANGITAPDGTPPADGPGAGRRDRPNFPL